MIEELRIEVLLVVVSIVGAAALGFISVLLSILRMHRESAFLQEWKEKLLPKNLAEFRRRIPSLSEKACFFRQVYSHRVRSYWERFWNRSIMVWAWGEGLGV